MPQEFFSRLWVSIHFLYIFTLPNPHCIAALVPHEYCTATVVSSLLRLSPSRTKAVTNELSSKERFAWLSGLMAKLLQIRLVLHCRPHLNFISGENGSGKSAALQCLQVCLGVQARLTGRAKTGKELINDSATVATAQVVLWNTVGILPSYPHAAHPSVQSEEHFPPYASCALNQAALSAVQHCILLSAYDSQ